MKKFLGILLSFILVVTLSPINVFAEENKDNNSPNTYSQEITIKDAEFKALLNKILSTEVNIREPNAPITQSDMAGLNNIEIGVGSSVTDIDGIEHAVNLKNLTIQKEVVGIEKIKGLSQLEKLYLNNFETNYSDLSFLGSKPNLKSIEYSSTSALKSLSGLTSENAPNLETLLLVNNSSLEDISVLGNVAFKNLKKLDLNGTKVKDVSVLKGYTSLKELNLEKINITDANRTSYIETVESLINLEQLDMPYCTLKDSDTVMFKPLGNLKRLILNMNDLTNTEFCSFLPEGLEILGLHGNQIKKADNLTRFKNLCSLGIGDNKITDLSFLNSFEKLNGWGERNSEGNEKFPTIESYEIEIPRSSTNNGTVVIDNPFKGVDGNYISFDGVKYQHGNKDAAEITSQAPYNKLTVKFIDSTNTFHFEAPYTVTLKSNLKLIAKMKITLKITGSAHVHKWGETEYTWSSDYSTCTAKRTCKEDNNHVESEVVNATKTVVKPATCTEKGKTQYTAKFTSLWTAEQTKTVEDIESTGHSYKDTWSTDENNHWHECELCGDVKDLDAHTFEWVIDKEATEEASGLKHQQCTVCAHKLAAVEIPQIQRPEIEEPHVHKWGKTEYVWSEDNTKCTAIRKCTLDGSHVETEVVDVVKKVVKPATTTEKGTTKYIADFENTWAVQQVKTIDDIPKIVVKPEANKPNTPKTGDDSNLLIYLALILGSVATIRLSFRKN